MKRVAVFGNAGGGKSTLARRLASLTGLPLHPIDRMLYRTGGEKVPHETYLAEHAGILLRDEWIIDGFGCAASAWARFARADTLVHVDLPLLTHYWWVTKRLVAGHFVTPAGWPEGSPMWRSSLSSYRVIRLCHERLTPRYREIVRDAAATKEVHHLRFPGELRAFLAGVERANRRD